MALNAKNIAYNRPGSVAAYYGWSADNIDKLIQSYTSGDSKNAANVAKHITGFLARRNTTLDAARPGQRINALDYAFREEARKQQTKTSFFDKIAGLVGPAVGILTGNPVLGAIAGGVSSAAAGRGVVGSILGAASGGAAGLMSPGVGALFGKGAPLTSINQYFPADIAARAGVSRGASILGQASATAQRLLGSPGAQVAQGASSGNSVRNFLTGSGGALLAGGAGIIGAAAGSGGAGAPPAAPAPARPPAPVNRSTPEVRRASSEERARAVAARGFEDTVVTGPRGVLSRARTRRKQILGA